jgi:uncharacterized protein (DUF169 family)
MSTCAVLATALTNALALKQSPVAVLLVDAIPDGVSAWTGSAPAGCHFWQEAATRTFATSARDHDLCAIGIYTHNLEPTDVSNTDLGSALKVFADLGYVRPEDVPQIPVLTTRRQFVIYGPLAEAPAPPDVVLLFVDAGQTLILSEAAQQIEGGTTPAMGRPACAIVPQAINSGQATLSLGCCGARAYLDVLTPDVALFAIPGPRLAAFTERVSALANANAILTQFHTIRRRDVEAGKKPTVAESLAAMGA